MFRQADRDQLDRIEFKLDALRALTRAQGMETDMNLDDLKAQVEAQTTVVDSAVTLLQQLKTMLDQAIASGDPAKIQAVADLLHHNTQALADAVVANTPAAS